MSLTLTGTGTNVSISTGILSCGHAVGLKVTNNGSTPNTQVNITAVQALLVTAAGVPYFVTAVSVTIDLTTGTATSTANGMDGEVRGTTAGTPLYMYLIGNGTTVAGLCTKTSPLVGSPTLPSGYTYALYCGALLIDGSGNLYRTLQYGRRTQYVLVAATNTTAYPIISNAAASYTSYSVATMVPPTAGSISATITTGTTAGTGAQLGSNASQVFYYGTTYTNGYPNSAAFSMILESSNVYFGNGGGNSGVASCTGWEDYNVLA